MYQYTQEQLDSIKKVEASRKERLEKYQQAIFNIH